MELFSNSVKTELGTPRSARTWRLSVTPEVGKISKTDLYDLRSDISHMARFRVSNDFKDVAIARSFLVFVLAVANFDPR